MKRYERFKEKWLTSTKVRIERLYRQDPSDIQLLWCGLLASSFILGLFLSIFSEWIAIVSIAALLLALITVVASIAMRVGIAIWRVLNGMLAAVRLSKIIAELQSRSKIDSAPGSRILSIVEFFYSPKTVEEVFKPIIADWRIEYFEALKHNRTIKARWISLRYKYDFAKAMGVSKVYSLFRGILSALFARK